MTQEGRPAAHSSFYLAMRILPAPRRDAMFAVYGFCRAVDDIADERGPATPSQRLKELDRWRADVARMFEGRPAPSFLGSVILKPRAQCVARSQTCIPTSSPGLTGRPSIPERS